jgi:hypothetical protein
LKYLSVKIHQGTWNTNTVPETEPPYLVSLLQYLILSPNGQKMTWLDLKWNNPIKLVFPDESNQILCIERNVIETESPVFQKMLNGSFVESNQVEIPIQESKSGTWVNVLLWMLKYPEWKASELEFDHMHAEEHCEVVFQIFQVSNRYMIESLQDGCVLWIQEMLLHAISQGNPFVPVIIYQWLSESHGILNPSRAHTLTKLCIKACVSTLPKRFH